MNYCAVFCVCLCGRGVEWCLWIIRDVERASRFWYGDGVFLGAVGGLGERSLSVEQIVDIGIGRDATLLARLQRGAGDRSVLLQTRLLSVGWSLIRCSVIRSLSSFSTPACVCAIICLQQQLLYWSRRLLPRIHQSSLSLEIVPLSRSFSGLRCELCVNQRAQRAALSLSLLQNAHERAHSLSLSIPKRLLRKMRRLR